jgi:uncharacterized protein (TIGR03437 family)
VFGAMSEVTLTNGAGSAVFEVADQNNSLNESAQIPTFLVFPGLPGGTPAPAAADVSFAPTDAPAVPRFVSTTPPSDCPALGDCDAAYFPHLSVTSQSLDFDVIANQAPIQRPVIINNTAGGSMPWTASVAYRQGQDWILLDPESGINNGTVRVWVRPQKVAGPGTYEAALTIDAGPLAGSRTATVRMSVRSSPIPSPSVTSIGNLANPALTRLAPGSRALIRGAAFTGGPVSVTFDGLPASIVSSSATEIDIQLPVSLGLRPTAQMVVSVGQLRSDPFTVNIDPLSAAIFPGGVINQDGAVNSPATGAPAGSALQIFATGLSGMISVRIHDRTVTPFWAGLLTPYPGVYQTNVFIPDDLPAMSTDVRVCGTTPDQQVVCSAPAPVTIR